MEDLSYIINSLAEDREQYFNAVAPPIVQTSNFMFKKVDDFTKAIFDESSTFLYSRGKNPTVDMLCEKLAALDEAEACLVLNSGATAIYVAVMSQVRAGDHIVSVKNVYWWAQQLFDVILPRYNITTAFVDGCDIRNIEAAIRPNTKMIYLESPTSWNMEEQDLPAIAKWAKSKNIITICDNSYHTPLYLKPITYGIDLVIQSATKYIGGHSDTLGGVLCGSKAVMKKIYASEFLNIGAGIMPFNAWLLLRGLRTMPVRLERIRQTTTAVMQYLQTHPVIETIWAPKDPMGLFTIVLKVPDRTSVVRFCESLHHFPMAVSWGGYESLAMPKCVSVPENMFDVRNPLHRSVRLYTGLEDAAFLIKDLEQALKLI